MKQKNLMYIALLSIASTLFGQKLPDDVQHRLDSLKNNTQIALYNARIFPEKGNMQCWPLQSGFEYPRYLLEKADKYNLNIGMLYDDVMRNRIVELMQNKYEEYELDTLINRRIANDVSRLEQKVLAICQFDTLQIFKTALDSFYINLEPKTMSKNMYKHPVLKLLQLDTTTIFRQSYQIAVERDRERVRDEYINETYYRRTGFAELCGHIGDKRFIKPLEEALDKPDNFERKTVLSALALMRVEPYYSDYIKFRMPRTMEQIKSKRPDFEFNELANIIRTQESFLEISNYLLSDVANSWEISDYLYPRGPETKAYPISDDAFDLIRDNIENEDIQDMIRNKNTRDNPEIIQIVYDWMQKNYGKYEIKRIW